MRRCRLCRAGLKEGRAGSPSPAAEGRVPVFPQSPAAGAALIYWGRGGRAEGAGVGAHSGAGVIDGEQPLGSNRGSCCHGLGT